MRCFCWASPILVRPWRRKARAFVRLRRASHFSLRGQRKVTQREATPLGAFRASLPGKSVSRGRAFRRYIRVPAKRHRLPVDARCAACRLRLTAAQGPRVEQRAILARHQCARHAGTCEPQPLAFAPSPLAQPGERVGVRGTLLLFVVRAEIFGPLCGPSRFLLSLLRLALAGRLGRQVHEPRAGFSMAHRATTPASPPLGASGNRSWLASTRASGNRSRVASTRASMPSPCRCSLCGLSRPRLIAAQGPRKRRVPFPAGTRCAAARRSQDQSASAPGLLICLLIWPFEECAQDARGFTRDPCAAVRAGRQARRVIGTDADHFSTGQDAPSKNPAGPHALSGQEARKAPSGGGLSSGYFSLATQRKVTRAPQAHESSCLKSHSPGVRMKTLACGGVPDQREKYRE